MTCLIRVIDTDAPDTIIGFIERSDRKADEYEIAPTPTSLYRVGALEEDVFRSVQDIYNKHVIDCMTDKVIAAVFPSGQGYKKIMIELIELRLTDPSTVTQCIRGRLCMKVQRSFVFQETTFEVVSSL